MKPRRSAIPTPGRSRSSSTTVQPVPVPDVELMSRAFADAIKANDPALHRTSRTSDFSAASLSPQSTSFGARPSSVASSASSVRPPERAKTPTTRPASRQSDVFGRSTSRATGRAFDIGDNVRIESLGYEGTLRFLGSIDGKPGLWAGVELGGGFAGKGKNDGSVAGKQYFTCPPNCGVFVASIKLSAPTVGPGAVHRPSSVASSRGRTTPSLSGRITPSTSSSLSYSTSARMTPSASTSRISTGRTTPANGGRITPSYAGRTPGATVTPAARARTRTLTKPTATTSPSASLNDKLTAGSRASKYVSMTAKQLSSRDATSSTPTRPPALAPPPSPARNLTSPSLNSRPIPSPTRTTASPFTTPKPSLGGRVSGGAAIGRPSVGTPRARIPSAIAMPPPASPITRSVSHNSESGAWGSPRPESAASTRSLVNEEREQMQSRIQALEYENQRFRTASVPPEVNGDSQAELEALRIEHDGAQSRAVELDTQLQAAQRSLEERGIQLQELENMRSQALASLGEEKARGDTRIQTLERELEETRVLGKTLTDTLSSKESVERESDQKLQAKQTEIVTLEARLKRIQLELDEERTELGNQVDELRQAGQETIALYEERLSAVDREKEELEARVATMEARARAAARTPSPSGTPKPASSATEIDNETLRDQVVHLQKKVSKLEDALEDAQAASEKEEAALAERMRRLKEKEEAARKELSEGRKEVERVIKSEANARRRVEEVEEALHESTAALEDARAEVEGLRSELTNLDGLVAGNGEGDLYSRVAQVVKRASADKARFTDEISNLNDLVEEALMRETEALKELEKLRQTFAAQTTEVEALKKKSNRDLSLNNGIQSPQSPTVSKHDLSAAKEEITGLKHIVQELQQESHEATQRTKLLEAENQLLLSEAEQLRQEVQILEENLDNSLTREENAVDEAPSGDATSLQRLMKDQKVKFEAELDQLRKRMADAEMKSARTVHDLNKEISELEALIESKIYREDELEQELERTKDKLARQRKSSKGSSEVVETRRRAGSVANSEVSDTQSEGVCEICEKPGHDIFTCSLLSSGASTDDRPTSDSELFCEDCESHGHVAAECPHSLDVF
ncbi:hypothetical protein R3P38DRAFT_3464352 [Favolaschia claudopus]|uniref:CAP-Gly domain-containing protein n=1 Tax=Favolaschia claudopus TaxID=2862362 RepID=A0AAV9ZFN1_9AGAR